MPPFQKGKSGNPAGRKPGTRSHVSRELVKIVKGDVARAVAKKLTALTLSGDMQAAKILMDRLEGRVSTADEMAKRQGGSTETLSPEQARKKLLEMLRQPELRALVESVAAPSTETVQ